MEELILSFFVTVLKETPGYFVLTILFVGAVFALYIKVRSINVDEFTNIGKMQSDNVAMLLTQVTQLSKDLAEARKEISSLYDKIDELESVIRVYRNKLRAEDFLEVKDHP